VTPGKRARGRSTARVKGQGEWIEKKGLKYIVKFREWIPGQPKPRIRKIDVCPVKGAGALSKPARERRAKELVAATGVDSLEHFAAVEEKERQIAADHVLTFGVQGESWLYHSQNRKRAPIKPATAAGYRSYLDKHLKPTLGEMPLSNVDNKTVKSLVEKLTKAKLSPKTTVSIVEVVKLVVASAVNENGEEVFPRKWNHEFMDLPIVKQKDQVAPIFTPAQVNSIIEHAKGRYRVLYAILAGTGLRIGEALALRINDEEGTSLSPDCKTLYVRKSIWNGSQQDPKTDNAIREVDLPGVLADVLKAFIGKRTSGYVFETDSGRPLSPRNILRDSLHKILVKIGSKQDGLAFHSFRRFRVTHLRDQSVPEDILRFWIGHADKSVTDRYSKMKQRIDSRAEWAEKAGTGFSYLAPICTHLHTKAEMKDSA
jgi:integrase